MQIVIDISDKMYQAVKDGTWCGNELWYNALKNGTPLPKNHGRLIDADEIQFERSEFETYGDYCVAFDAIDNAEIIIPADGGEEIG